MSLEDVDKEYIGYKLLRKGFKSWFQYMFRVIESRSFILEPIHKDIFKLFEDIHNQKVFRCILNEPPRSAKTTLAKYFLVYELTNNPRCNFIYTSYSQDLLNDISREVANIMENPVYKALYPYKSFNVESEDANPVDEFWKDYLLENNKTAKYTSKKIITKEGGVVLFSAIGATITGFGCFEYDTLVSTENGMLKMGDIVENKMNVFVHSYNFEKEEVELKPICDFIKNKSQSYKKLTLDNGEIIKATTEHIFYKHDGSEVMCKDLKVGSKLLSNSLVSNAFRFFRPIYSRFYVGNKIPFKSGYREIIDIVDIYDNSSYCLSIEGNNNLFITNSKVLVHNCGLRGAKGFTGGVIIDDANKPADVRSALMRNKVFRYFEETLLNRLNNSNALILNIQQRLHKEDLSGHLQRVYKYKTFKMPLIKDGVCQIPSQYTKERLEELQKNNATFLAQFQQEPVVFGGQVIKTGWFKYYVSSQSRKYIRVFITGDTAQKVKEANDYSVFCVWGVTPLHKLQLIEMVRGKWEAPDLKKQAIMLWNRYREPIGGAYCSALYVEDKSSGTGLIQELKGLGVPIIGLQRDKDKLTRVSTATPYMEAGQVELPDCPEMNKDFLDECESFTRDDSHPHDDIVDNLSDAVKIGLSNLNVSILNVL